MNEIIIRNRLELAHTGLREPIICICFYSALDDIRLAAEIRLGESIYTMDISKHYYSELPPPPPGELVIEHLLVQHLLKLMLISNFFRVRRINKMKL